MSMARWDPIRDMMSLRHGMARLFEDSFLRPSRVWRGLAGEHDMPVDIYETATEVVVKASLPGVKAEATFEQGVLTLKIPKAEVAKPKSIKIKTGGVTEGTKK